jgi:hypothetical protein
MVETLEHVAYVPAFIPWTEDLFFSKTLFRRQLRFARISFTLKLFSDRLLGDLHSLFTKVNGQDFLI